MLLAVDVGNTQSVLGLYEGAELRHMWRIATCAQSTADELRISCKSLFDAQGLATDKVDSVVLASVVPRLTRSWDACVRELFGVPALAVDARVAGDLFKTDYPNPNEIGADRVADAVAAVACCGAPVVVVDFGTATNIEIVDAQGRFAGGIIAPGVETSAQALFSRAARLASIDLADPCTAIGHSTEQAVQAGIVYGEADRVDGLLRRVFEQLGYTAPVVATGGLAPCIVEHMRTPAQVEPALTLEGLRLIARSCV